MFKCIDTKEQKRLDTIKLHIYLGKKSGKCVAELVEMQQQRYLQSDAIYKEGINMTDVVTESSKLSLGGRLERMKEVPAGSEDLNKILQSLLTINGALKKMVLIQTRCLSPFLNLIGSILLR